MKKQVKLTSKSENTCKKFTNKVPIFINADDFAKCSTPPQSVRQDVLTGKTLILGICP